MHDPDLVGEFMEKAATGPPVEDGGAFARFANFPPAAPISAEWVFDPMGANAYARTHARELKYPPHWVRCDFMRNGVRCCKGADHHKGTGKAAEHEEPKV